MSDNVATCVTAALSMSAAPPKNGPATCTMKTPARGPLAFLVLALLMTCPMSQARAETATELIEQARQHDATFTIGPEVNRSKAIELYEKALAAQPDQQQRLDVLFRMAQLQGCVFDRKKGEKPDYRKAINLYQQIVESYPSEEPLVVTAIGLISDHYTTLREFDAALLWARRAVNYDTTKAEENVKEIHRKVRSLATTRYSPQERRAIIEQKVRSASLQENLKRMRAERVTAVDRLAFAAQVLDPLQAHGELRAIADKYAGTPVGDRATQKLREAMDKQVDLWAPSLELPRGPVPSLEPPANVPILLPRHQNGVETPAGPFVETTTGSQASEPNTTEQPKRAVPLTESPRAPPLGLLAVCLVAAVSLVVLGLAAPRIRRRTLSRNHRYET